MVTLFLCIPALAQSGNPPPPKPLILTDEQGEYPLGLHLELLEDPSRELTIEEVSSPEFESRFTLSQEAVPNYGFTNSVYWVRLRLDNETHQTDEWLLEVGFANMQYVDLYTPLPDGGGFEVKQTGSLRPVSTRDVLYPRIVFDLILPSQSQQTYYLCFQSGASMTLGLTLWTKDVFSIESQWELMLNWLFYGALLALLVYHLFLLFSLREATYLYFVILLASLIFINSSYDGYLEVYLLPNLYYLKPIYFPLSYSFLMASMLLFSDAFLELKTRLQKIHWMNIAIAAGWGALMLLTPFTSFHVLAILMVPWALISLIATLVAGVVSWRQGFHPARFFMIAWFGLIVCLILVILVRFGLAPSTIFSENIYKVGIIWMGVCWSIALADRINLLKAKTESANRDLRNSEHRLSQILEGLPIGVILYGKDQKSKYINRRAVNILSNPDQGVQPDLSVGRTLAQEIQHFSLKIAGSPQEYPVEKFPMNIALQGETTSTDDVEIVQGDKRVALEFWASPVRDDAGKVESAVLAFQDITQRKQAEAELYEHREHLEQLVADRTDELILVNEVLQTEISERERLQEELNLRMEWLTAVNLANQSVIYTKDLPQVYQKFTALIPKLFGSVDGFIAEMDTDSQKLIIRTHSAQEDPHQDWIGATISLPSAILSNRLLGEEKYIIFSREQLSILDDQLSKLLQVFQNQFILLAPLRFQERVVGLLGLLYAEAVQSFSASDTALLEKICFDIVQMRENARSSEQTQALIAAEERSRLARDLHDSVTQTLFTASVLAEATPRLWNKNQGIARQNMEKLSLLIRGALAEMRSMLIELRSEDLITQTLDQLLTTLVEAARARSRAVINLSIMDIPELPKEVTLTLYRVAREALNNALVHSTAAQINISLLAEPGQVEVHIQDDGCGFDPQAVTASHLGIRIMVEHAAKIGGEVRIHSEPGQGTEIVLTWASVVEESAEYD